MSCSVFCLVGDTDQSIERVLIFGKSSVGIQGVIKAAIDIDVTVFSSSELPRGGGGYSGINVMGGFDVFFWV